MSFSVLVPQISDIEFEKFLESPDSEHFFDLQMHLLREAYKKGFEDGFKRAHAQAANNQSTP